MANFQIISNKIEADFPTYTKWVDKPHSYSKRCNFDAKGQLVGADYQGKIYTVCSEKVHYFGAIERGYRGFLGVLALCATLGLAALSKSVRNLFVKDHTTIRYAILDETPSKIESPMTIDQVKQINVWHAFPENRSLSTNYRWDLITSDEKVFYGQDLTKEEIQALIRKYPTKINVFDQSDFTEKPDDVKLKPEKVLKYLAPIIKNRKAYNPNEETPPPVEGKKALSLWQRLFAAG